MNSDIVGIDLGTTNSLVTIWRNGSYEIIPDIEGRKSIPSIVGFTKAKKYIGNDAKNMLELDPKNTIYEVKRLIGRKYSDEIVTHDKNILMYDICDRDGNIDIISYDRKYSPEEISSMILGELKVMAEEYLKKSISKAVITVPAYFNDAQRQATKDAATIAGLNCIRIINEPTAAALAYGLQEKSADRDINIIVYDLGGGTLDVSLLNINDGVFQVLASTGNTHLGGTDFDVRLMNWCIGEFRRVHNFSSLSGFVNLQKLRKSVEQGKKLLSIQSKTVINVNNFYKDIDLNITITRTDFENICQDLFIMSLKPLEDVLDSANMTVSDIDDIILVGGATRMAAIRKNIKLYFKGKEPNCSINPDNVVSIGAAIQGFIIGNKDSPFSQNITLLDIIPLSLGIETIDNIMDVIVERNSIIPVKKEKKFTTDTDFMESVEIKIFEGERKLTTNNNLLGTFTLDGIEKEYRGGPQINVIFDIDINGIISVTAEDIKNKNSSSIIVKNNSKNRLTAEEIKKLVNEAEQLAIFDGIERRKKILIYKVQDLCLNVKFNIDNDSNVVFDNKKVLDVEKILNLIKNEVNTQNPIFFDMDLELAKVEPNLFNVNEKTNTISCNVERDSIEYLKSLKKLVKKEYGILVYKKNKKNLTDYSEYTKTGENIYNNDIDTKSLDYVINIDYDDGEDLKTLRESLMSLCNDVVEIMEFRKNIDNNLKNIVDDTIMWLYIKDNIKKNEYINKLDDINSLYSEYNSAFMNTLDNVVTDNTLIKIKKESLEELCYNILGVILSNNYSLHDVQIKVIQNLITEILDYVLQENIEIIDLEQYEIRLNEECNELYKLLMSVKK